MTQHYLNIIYGNEEPRPTQLLARNKYLNISLFQNEYENMPVDGSKELPPTTGLEMGTLKPS